MSFRDFPEQRPIVALLQKSLASARLGHAYLFSGSSIGEMQELARTLAKTLNCENPPERGEGGQGLDSCDRCSACKRIDNGNHPDLQWVRPESKSRIITIEQVRELIQVISLKPTESRYKVAIMVSADRMNAQAANAFLKTLEEPPDRSVLVLLTTDLERILETILSRCLRLNFAGEAVAKTSPEEQDWLRSMAEMASQPSKSLLGRYRLLSLLTTRLAGMKEQVREQLEASSLIKKYPDAEKDTKEKWEAELNGAIEAEYRRRRAELLLLFQWWMRDIWLSSLRVQGTEPALPELQEATGRLAARITAEQATANLRTLDRLQYQLQATNVQEALALEIGLLKLSL